MHVSDYVIITLQSGRNMNIKEIAKKLGVSTATVSRALNDQPGVSQEMREMIIKTATQLEYLPNHYARGL
ncbi:MAG: LacI family DNA-binding transcriptional regulator, partial [bacterium]